MAPVARPESTAWRDWQDLYDFIDQLRIDVEAGANSGSILTTPPNNPDDLTWWIEVSGTSPNRIIALKVQDEGYTYTLASIQL
jgi:hypothetical protein